MRTRDEIEADLKMIVGWGWPKPSETVWASRLLADIPALLAALGVAEAALVEQMPNAKAPNTGAWYDAGEWVAVEVDACTCGTPELTYGHEAGCGLEPAFKCATVEDALIAVREHNEVLGREEMAEAALARAHRHIINTVDPLLSGDEVKAACLAITGAALAAVAPTPEPPAKPETRYVGASRPMRDPYAPVSEQPKEQQ